MIRYQLVCDRGDRFEAWFRSSDDFDLQHEIGDIQCPLCGSESVDKALMAPAVRSARRSALPTEPGGEVTQISSTRGASSGNAANMIPAASNAPANIAGGADPSVAKAMEMMRSIARHIRENSDNVGRGFAEEARKIHYKEAPARSIVGEATAREARELAEEGIEFHALPVLPEDRN